MRGSFAAAAGCAFALALTSGAALADDIAFVPVIASDVGMSLQFEPDHHEGIHFAGGAVAGVTAFFSDYDFDAEANVIVGGELGYAFTGGYDANTFTLAPYIGIGSTAAGLTYTPRLILGTGGVGSLAVGIRNSIVGHFLFDCFRIEVGHQLVDYAGSLQQDVHIMLGGNLGAGIYMLVLAISSIGAH